MPRDVGIELLRAPVLHVGAEFRLRQFDAALPVHFREAAGEHRLGLVIERAQQLCLPGIPHAGADRADVGRSEDQQQLHALERLHDRGEILDRLAVGKVARLRDGRHHQMLLDQPGDCVGLGRREAEPRPEAACDTRARD